MPPAEVVRVGVEGPEGGAGEAPRMGRRTAVLGSIGLALRSTAAAQGPLGLGGAGGGGP